MARPATPSAGVGRCRPPGPPALERLQEVYSATVRFHGGDPTIGPRLPALLATVGLSDVGEQLVANPMTTVDQKLFLAELVDNIRQAMLEARAARPGELDDLGAAAARDPGTVFHQARIHRCTGTGKTSPHDTARRLRWPQVNNWRRNRRSPACNGVAMRRRRWRDRGSAKSVVGRSTPRSAPPGLAAPLPEGHTHAWLSPQTVRAAGLPAEYSAQLLQAPSQRSHPSRHSDSDRDCRRNCQRHPLESAQEHCRQACAAVVLSPASGR